MTETERGLDHLEVWQRSISFAVMICREIVILLPAEEKYSLTAQLRRSAQSVPANIAEGYGRYHYQDNIRFCYIARGSLEETYTHLTLAHKLGYLSDTVFRSCLQDIQMLRKLINGYIAYLKRTKIGQNEPGASLREPTTAYDLHDLPINQSPIDQSRIDPDLN
jgi:four helix bundle protein